MAYNSNNLSALSYANGFTLWHYKTADSAQDVLGQSYFNEAATMLRVGDFILTNAQTDSAAINGTLAVMANDGDHVAVAESLGLSFGGFVSASAVTAA